MPIKAKNLKHQISFTFICPTNNVEVHATKNNPAVFTGSYFSDWEYQYTPIKCPECGKEHDIEI